MSKPPESSSGLVKRASTAIKPWIFWKNSEERSKTRSSKIDLKTFKIFPTSSNRKIRQSSCLLQILMRRILMLLIAFSEKERGGTECGLFKKLRTAQKLL